MLSVTCPRCNSGVHLDDEDAGELTRCPVCRKQFVAPETSEESRPVSQSVRRATTGNTAMSAIGWLGSAIGLLIALFYFAAYPTFCRTTGASIITIDQMANRSGGIEFGVGLSIASAIFALYHKR